MVRGTIGFDYRPSAPSPSGSGRAEWSMPFSLILSTAFHACLFFFMLSEGLLTVTPKKTEFVKVSLVELPAGTGGALSGKPGGKAESKAPDLRPKAETKPRLTLPGKEPLKEEGKTPVRNPDPEGKAVGLGGKGTAGLGGSQRGLLLDAENFEYEWYKARLEQALKSAWRRPYLKKKISSSVHFVIQDSGSVRDVQIVKSSGNSDFDRSVLKAVYDSQPFPKFPPGYASPSLGVLYTFELEPDKN